MLPTSSYAGSCSRFTSIGPFEAFTGLPFSLAISAACVTCSFILSNVDWKSKAPPSLNVSLICMTWCCAEKPPPAVGINMPSQTFGPKKGAVTWVSWRDRRGIESDLNCGVGFAGR